MNWMKYKWLYFLLSALVLVPGITSLVLFGLSPAIDFTGGSLLELKTEGELNPKEVEGVIGEKGFEVLTVQTSGKNQILIRLQPIEKEQANEIKSAIQEKFEQEPEEVRFETVGPTLGKELITKTIWAIVLAAGFILAYVPGDSKTSSLAFVPFSLCSMTLLFFWAVFLYWDIS